MTFESASKQLSGRCAQRRKVGNNTYLERRENGSIAVRLHSTDVLTFHPNGNTTLDSGGWKTVTTKARMNEHLSVRGIRSERGIWYLETAKGQEYVYQDGMILHADGTVTGQGEDPKPKIKLRRRISQYAKAYMSALAAGDVPAPSGGDCWYCFLRPSQVSEIELAPDIKGHSASGFYDGNGKRPMGESFGDTSHLESHLAEKYYVPSLLARAVERFKVSQAAMWYLGSFWDTTANRLSARRAGEMCADQLQSALRQYLVSQFGMQA